jgi:hypothetical protein
MCCEQAVEVLRCVGTATARASSVHRVGFSPPFSTSPISLRADFAARERDVAALVANRDTVASVGKLAACHMSQFGTTMPDADHRRKHAQALLGPVSRF